MIIIVEELVGCKAGIPNERTIVTATCHWALTVNNLEFI